MGGKKPTAAKTARRRRRRTGRRRSVLRRLGYWGALVAAWCLIGLAALTAYYVNDLPDIDAVGAVARQPRVTLSAADGTVFATYGDRREAPVPARRSVARIEQPSVNRESALIS